MIRRDPVTGILTSHASQLGKPFPTLARDVPEPPGPCRFCQLVAGETPDRPLDHSIPGVLLAPNRWSPLGEYADARLVIAGRHTESVEELLVEEWEPLCGVLVEAARRHRRAHRPGLASVNVGRYAGASQPHLHGQDVAIDHPAVPFRPLSPEHVATDVRLAREAGTVLIEDARAVVYAPWAPTRAGELRVVSPDATRLAREVHHAVTAVSARCGPRSYNLTIDDAGPALLARLVSRFDLDALYPSALGFTVVTVPVEEFVERVRPAYIAPER